jgi:hypothetical protein
MRKQALVLGMNVKKRTGRVGCGLFSIPAVDKKPANLVNDELMAIKEPVGYN